jgi:lipopolysaccharide heptosyltransferase II
MLSNWHECKNILCIRPDNMGDLIMTGPALRALKGSFNAKITVLTSTMAAGIASSMPEIDEVMICDLPWVKTDSVVDASIFTNVIEQIKQRQFDAAVIFTVYSQNPLPTVMLAFLAGIPRRLAYCRENPYQLLTDWVPEKEPYLLIKHQVQRDLDLVARVGADTCDDRLFLKTKESITRNVQNKIRKKGVDMAKPWLILHPGVSEIKRQYPEEKWIAAGKRITGELGYQVVITGSGGEAELTGRIQDGIGKGSYATGGIFNLDEFIALIKLAPVAVSVNTGTVHIAAAVGTPVLVLYALTNPQHTPWKAPHLLLPFSVDQLLKSKNEVIRYVNEHLYAQHVPFPDDEDIMLSVKRLLTNTKTFTKKVITAN